MPDNLSTGDGVTQKRFQYLPGFAAFLFLVSLLFCLGYYLFDLQEKNSDLVNKVDFLMSKLDEVSNELRLTEKKLNADDLMIADLQVKMKDLQVRSVNIKPQVVLFLINLNMIERYALYGKDVSRYIALAIEYSPTQNIRSLLERIANVESIASKSKILSDYRGLIRTLKPTKYHERTDIISKIKEFFSKYILFVRSDEDLIAVEGLIQNDDFSGALSLLSGFGSYRSDELEDFKRKLAVRIMFYDTLDDVYSSIAVEHSAI